MPVICAPYCYHLLLSCYAATIRLLCHHHATFHYHTAMPLSMLLFHCHAALPLICHATLPLPNCFASIVLLCQRDVDLPLSYFLSLLGCFDTVRCFASVMLLCQCYDALPLSCCLSLSCCSDSVMLLRLCHAAMSMSFILLWQHLCDSYCRPALPFPASLACRPVSPLSHCCVIAMLALPISWLAAAFQFN